MAIRNVLTNLHINPKNIAKSTVNAGKEAIRFDKLTPEMASNNAKAYGVMLETQDMSAVTAKDGKLLLSNMDNGNIEKEIIRNNPYESYTVVYDKNGKLTQLREQVANKPEVIVE
ncbi:MAG: hypothetical protein KH301_05330 [Brachyspira sp.]|nr:hypothetical protein [Brachyspira sp.]